MKIRSIAIFVVILIFTLTSFGQNSYPIVETGVHSFYSNTAIISTQSVGAAFYGQDATYQGNEPSYTSNGNGTITDNVTGLIWQKDMGTKITFSKAFIKADTMTLGGYSDWRVPTIKELYSLIKFTGQSGGTTSIKKYIDTVYFNQPIGDTTIGERVIDAQTWSSTQYKGLTMNGDSTVFGVNFIDGRIKGYPKYLPGSGNTNPNSMYFRMVRGNTNYGINHFVNNNDGTISDTATGLMWQQADDGIARDWENALSYAENLTLANYTDWRLPNAKELNSIVDYSRSPSYTNSAAIDPLFIVTSISDPNGVMGQYPYFWTSTSHLDGANPYSAGVYFAFGKAQGKMNGTLLDVHGAGAQRSDPKTGTAADYPQYFGPQGDVRYVFNYTRCVRTISGSNRINEQNELNLFDVFPNPTSDNCTISFNKSYSNVKIVLYNTLGTKVKETVISNLKSTQISINDLPKGVYLIQISADNSVFTNRIIKL
ncbi:MAG: DUF1566 domain-containing protein [Bacteroidota bacterium]